MVGFNRHAFLIRTFQTVNPAVRPALAITRFTSLSAAAIQAVLGLRCGRSVWWWRALFRLPFRHPVDLLT